MKFTILLLSVLVTQSLSLPHILKTTNVQLRTQNDVPNVPSKPPVLDLLNLKMRFLSSLFQYNYSPLIQNISRLANITSTLTNSFRRSKAQFTSRNNDVFTGNTVVPTKTKNVYINLPVFGPEYSTQKPLETTTVQQETTTTTTTTTDDTVIVNSKRNADDNVEKNSLLTVDTFGKNDREKSRINSLNVLLDRGMLQYPESNKRSKRSMSRMIPLMNTMRRFQNSIRRPQYTNYHYNNDYFHHHQNNYVRQNFHSSYDVPKNYHHNMPFDSYGLPTEATNDPIKPFDEYGLPNVDNTKPIVEDLRADKYEVPFIDIRQLSNTYGPPLNTNPKPSEVYGPPEVTNVKPSEVYGPPDVTNVKPSEVYGPPEVTNVKPFEVNGTTSIKPSEVYGPPDITNVKPSEVYGPPDVTNVKPSEGYGSSEVTNVKPSEIDGTSSIKPSEVYGPPEVTNVNPSEVDGPTSVKPSEVYGPPDVTNIKPSEVYGPPEITNVNPSEVDGPTSVKPSIDYGPPEVTSTEPSESIFLRPTGPTEITNENQTETSGPTDVVLVNPSEEVRNIKPSDVYGPPEVKNNELFEIYGFPEVKTFEIYGPPDVKNIKPSEVYGPPEVKNVKPSDIYGPPEVKNNELFEIYGFPEVKAFEIYGPPDVKNIKPSEVYGPPEVKNVKPSRVYGTPEVKNIKLSKIYGPPRVKFLKPSEVYSFFKTKNKEPSTEYGPPEVKNVKPSRAYSPPKVKNVKPSEVYGPPEVKNVKPSRAYGPPEVKNVKPAAVYGPPEVKNVKPTAVFGLPEVKNVKLSTVYGPPEVKNVKPSKVYGLPEVKNDKASSVYGPPEVKNDKPSRVYSPPEVKNVKPSRVVVKNYSWPKTTSSNEAKVDITKFIVSENYDTIDKMPEMIRIPLPTYEDEFPFTGLVYNVNEKEDKKETEETVTVEQRSKGRTSEPILKVNNFMFEEEENSSNEEDLQEEVQDEIAKIRKKVLSDKIKYGLRRRKKTADPESYSVSDINYRHKRNSNNIIAQLNDNKSNRNVSVGLDPKVMLTVIEIGNGKKFLIPSFPNNVNEPIDNKTYIIIDDVVYLVPEKENIKDHLRMSKVLDKTENNFDLKEFDDFHTIRYNVSGLPQGIEIYVFSKNKTNNVYIGEDMTMKFPTKISIPINKREKSKYRLADFDHSIETSENNKRKAKFVCIFATNNIEEMKNENNEYKNGPIKFEIPLYCQEEIAMETNNNTKEKNNSTTKQDNTNNLLQSINNYNSNNATNELNVENTKKDVEENVTNSNKKEETENDSTNITTNIVESKGSSNDNMLEESLLDIISNMNDIMQTASPVETYIEENNNAINENVENTNKLVQDMEHLNINNTNTTTEQTYVEKENITPNIEKKIEKENIINNTINISTLENTTNVEASTEHNILEENMSAIFKNINDIMLTVTTNASDTDITKNDKIQVEHFNEQNLASKTIDDVNNKIHNRMESFNSTNANSTMSEKENDMITQTNMSENFNYTVLTNISKNDNDDSAETNGELVKNFVKSTLLDVSYDTATTESKMRTSRSLSLEEKRRIILEKYKARLAKIQKYIPPNLKIEYFTPPRPRNAQKIINIHDQNILQTMPNIKYNDNFNIVDINNYLDKNGKRTKVVVKKRLVNS